MPRTGCMLPTGGFRSGRHAGVVVILTVVFVSACQERPSDAEELEESLSVVTPKLTKSHVRFLSHDLLRGRGTGDVGFALATQYVVSQFERIGLEPGLNSSFLQPFGVRTVVADQGSELHAGNQVLNASAVEFNPALENGGESIWEGDAVYLGYGLFSDGRDDYGGTDVVGKAVVMLQGTPPDWPMGRLAQRAAWAKAEMALRRGAAVVIQLSDGGVVAAPAQPDSNPSHNAGPFAPDDGTVTSIRPAATVGPEGSRLLLQAWGISRPAEPAGAIGSIRLVRRHEMRTVQSWNVIGVIRGHDPLLRDEAVVFSAHLDHVGVCTSDATSDDICNGTHDNALGIAKMLAAAESMVRLRPRRSVVFAAMGAEEGGLIGSWHYVRHPIFAMEKTVANINMDGGRTGNRTDDVIANAADVSDMSEIVEKVMGELGVGLTNGESSAELVGLSSDHRSFLFAGVPAVDLKPGYSVDGDSEVGYQERIHYMNTWRHRPADEFDESFTFESTVEMTRRAVHLAWYLTNMEGMPQMNPHQPMARGRSSPGAPFYFGPHYDIEIQPLPD